MPPDYLRGYGLEFLTGAGRTIGFDGPGLFDNYEPFLLNGGE